MKNELTKEYIFNFLQRQKIGVLSTVNKKNLPDAAPIVFIINKNFDVFFITPFGTQKYLNLVNQPEVVFTITDDKTNETVQIRGLAKKNDALITNILGDIAEKLNDGNPENDEKHLITSLPLLEYKDQDKTAVKIKPYQIRMRRYNETEFEEKIIIVP